MQGIAMRRPRLGTAGRHPAAALKQDDCMRTWAAPLAAQLQHCSSASRRASRVRHRHPSDDVINTTRAGVLNHKYAGECALRAAGVPYAVVRATGLTNEDAGTSFLLEARQGDTISGKVARGEVAAVVAAALGASAAAGGPARA